MFRFTIRDLVWLMAVGALAIGWLANRWHLISVAEKVNREREDAWLMMDELMKEVDVIKPDWRATHWHWQPNPVFDAAVRDIKDRRERSDAD